jgi:hypothetical protein
MEGLIVARRAAGSLIPANDDALAFLEKIAIGELVTLKLDQPRSLAELRFYWAMLNHVGDAIGSTKDELHDELRRHLGYYREFKRKNGEACIELLSTSFPEMTQADYHDYVVKARETLASHVGMTVDELSDEVCREKGVPPIPERATAAARPSDPGADAPALVAAPVAQPTAAARELHPEQREVTASSAAPAAAAPIEPTTRPRTAAEQQTYAAQLIAWIPVASEDALADHMKAFHGPITAIRERFPEVGDRIDAALDGRR